MADNKQAFQAGYVAGKTEEKSNNVLIEKPKDAAAGAGASAQTAGQKIAEAPGGADNFVKEKTGLGK